MQLCDFFVASGGLSFGEQLKCENSVVNVYLILSGLWGIATFVLLVGSCVYWGCKDKEKDQYCRYCSCAWHVFVFVLVVFGGCFLLYLIGMITFVFTASFTVYGSFQSYTNPTMNQTLQCSPITYYFSFVSVTCIYIFFGILAIAGASVYFYTKLLRGNV